MNDEHEFNLGGSPLTLVALGMIVTALETHGSVRITNCRTGAPGESAVTLGAMLGTAIDFWKLRQNNENATSTSTQH